MAQGAVLPRWTSQQAEGSASSASLFRGQPALPPTCVEGGDSPELPPLTPASDKFPFCLVWSPLPVIGWLVPFIGHVGICRSDGTILDFAGSYFVNVCTSPGKMAFGSPSRILRLTPAQACLPHDPSDHLCSAPHSHEEYGTSSSWDDAIAAVTRQFQHQEYNIFTTNCHSFVSCCLNRMAYNRHLDWTLVHVGWALFVRGVWLSSRGPLIAYGPFIIVLSMGTMAVGPAFLLCWAVFALLLLLWYTLGTLCHVGIIKSR